MIAMGFPIVMFDRWVSPSTRAAPLVFWQFFPRTAAPPTRMGAVVKMDGSNTCLARSNADKPSPHRTLNLRPMSSAFSQKNTGCESWQGKNTKHLAFGLCVLVWVHVSDQPKKISSFPHTLKSYKHLTDAWVKIGDLPPKKCPGIFPAHVMGFLSFLSFLRSLGLKLGFKRWSLDPSPRSQLCYASWSSPDLMGSGSECYPWTMLNHVEACWTMKGSRAWQFAPAVPKHRWSNQRSGLIWSENPQDCGVMSQDFAKWFLSESIFGGTQ